MLALSDEDIRELLPHLQRFALWLTRDVMAAEDLVQNTLIKALDGPADREEVHNLRTWLFSILWRQFIDGERRRKRWQKLLTFFQQEAKTDVGGENSVMADETLALFAHLPAESRALLLLISVEEMSYREAAEALNIPLGTVMSRLSRARKQLRQLTEEHASPAVLRRLK
ncbi:RNA polymerase sigma factor [Raoultella terrigena]|jgi:RNA polymerase sigma-70 factor (ECF subfamily)|uniref:RNA polymerase sigma factor n=1 Tax=Raoultella terrigena TaxID=577 RepID=UPI0009777898|nr:sigma-70 family RNA polymerase sigma factor [Raoultella terrigena]OMP95606.1 RNA polymerase subunit sigma-24 [Raoultella terrigena]